jgi:hypothetical protein
MAAVAMAVQPRRIQRSLLNSPMPNKVLNIIFTSLRRSEHGMCILVCCIECMVCRTKFGNDGSGYHNPVVGRQLLNYLSKYRNKK